MPVSKKLLLSWSAAASVAAAAQSVPAFARLEERLMTSDCLLVSERLFLCWLLAAAQDNQEMTAGFNFWRGIGQACGSER
jgi:hypothetical protein